MFKNIIKVLTITLMIMILVLVYKVIGNIKIKKEIKEASTVFNEDNEKYINEHEGTGVIEYKSGILYKHNCNKEN